MVSVTKSATKPTITKSAITNSEGRICKGIDKSGPCRISAVGTYKFCFRHLDEQRSKMKSYLEVRYLPYTGHEVLVNRPPPYAAVLQNDPGDGSGVCGWQTTGYRKLPVWLDSKGWEEQGRPSAGLWVDPTYGQISTHKRPDRAAPEEDSSKSAPTSPQNPYNYRDDPILFLSFLFPKLESERDRHNVDTAIREGLGKKRDQVTDLYHQAKEREQEYINWSLSLPGFPTNLHRSVFYVTWKSAEDTFERADAEYAELLGTSMKLRG